jgi:hypothetical protein
MRCGRISAEGKAEEIEVSPRPRYWQRHGKRSNPYSTRGLDEFESVYAELSAKREYIASKFGVSEAMVRFMFSKKEWIPVVLRARDQGTRKKNSGEDAAGVSILGPVDKSNSVNHEHEHHNHLHDSEAKEFRSPMSMDNPHGTRRARPVQGSESFYRRTKEAMAYDARVGASVMIITLLCFVFYGRLCAILFTGAWLYLLPMFREGSERMRKMNRNNDIRMVYLQSSEYKKKVIMDGFLDRRHK